MSLTLTHKSSPTHLGQLLALNLVLQAFDGIATYQGLGVGWKEGNPLLAAVFALLGVGPALLLFKLKACGLILLLHRHTPPRVATKILGGLAAVYCALSLAPWMAKFGYLAISLV